MRTNGSRHRRSGSASDTANAESILILAFPGARGPAPGVITKFGTSLGSPEAWTGIPWNLPSGPCGSHWRSPGDFHGLPGRIVLWPGFLLVSTEDVDGFDRASSGGRALQGAVVSDRCPTFFFSMLVLYYLSSLISFLTSNMV